MQLCNSDDLGLSVSTNNSSTLRTSYCVAVYFVSTWHSHFAGLKSSIYEYSRLFSGVVGVIDGTHIRISAPSEDKDAYVNRKRYHSINIQVVFSADYRILDIVAKWPGATRHARIVAESCLRHLFERCHVPANCHLVGDSGFPCKPWLLTPYLHPDQGSQLNYNR